ncbi:MAG: T9SS type A sorting domain-containing protein [Saprospiraceae bacterium]|nr:T9SS type A sorting domain-containing protein [Saprospiraceae bacterium]
MGRRRSLLAYSPYYSIAPSICRDDGAGSFLLTYKNESEEFYDFNQMIIYQLDESGNIVHSRIDSTYDFDYDGEILFGGNELIVSSGADVYRFTRDLELIDSFRISSQIYEDFDIINVDSAHLKVARKSKSSLYDPKPANIKQLITYYFGTGQIVAFDLNDHPGVAVHSDSSLYIYGSDKFLRRLDLTSFTVRDSIFWSDLDNFRVIEEDGKVYASAVNQDNLLGLYLIDFSNQKLDTIWSFSTREQIFDMAIDNNSIFLLTSLELDDGSYRSMSYPVFRKISLAAPILIPRQDIAIDKVEVLQSFDKEENLNFPDGSFSGNVPAIVGITVRNNSDLQVGNFGYFSESTGGSFCVPGRTSKYVEATILPGDLYYFQDTIYPYQGPAVEFELSFHVAAPNHQIDMDSTDNRFIAKLYTTATRNHGFKPLDIYPNPAAEFVNLTDVGLNGGRLELINIKGQLIQLIDSWNGALQITDLIPGIYLLKYTLRQEVRYARFIKQ